jgi:hypothetical protein
MEPLQKQVTTLSQKVDALYQVVDQLNGQVADALSECRLTPMQDGNGNFLATENTGRYPSLGYSSYKPTMEHKDVLTDNNSQDANKSGEKELSPEIQIRRLTAQLTAAYNRIAALEEQLLAQRIH